MSQLYTETEIESGKSLKPVKIKVCTGSHCRELKGKKVAKRLRNEIEEQGMEDRMVVKGCDCLGKCKKGPLIIVPSRDLEYTHVKLKGVLGILEEITRACGK